MEDDERPASSEPVDSLTIAYTLLKLHSYNISDILHKTTCTCTCTCNDVLLEHEDAGGVSRDLHQTADEEVEVAVTGQL